MAEKPPVSAFDVTQVAKHFEAAEAEARLGAAWEAAQIYKYDPTRSRAETFVVDTPPPTVSGSLHIGHLFSYTHADVIARQRRMLGHNIFYPMGWDDNGLPTERRVQNYFHVRCDPLAAKPSDEPLPTEMASKEQREAPPRVLSRDQFIALCLELTGQDEQAFKALWQRIGLSVDWSLEYSTINQHCRRTAQLSFLDLWEKKHLYQSERPTMWDVDFQSTVALAEVEERNTPGAYHTLQFRVEGSADVELRIATTRPELLPACVGVTAHPDDARYKALFGKRAITPLFSAPVPIFPSERVDPEKGTGLVMVCTFGDQTDVLWWREQKLPLRQVLARDGRFAPITFGTPGWDSVDAEKANAVYAPLVGKKIAAARTALVEALTASGTLLGAPTPIQHAVKYFEKGDRPLETITTRQWFVRLVDKREQLLAKGAEIAWHPEYMAQRFKSWTENLQEDWCVSRQRFFGVPIPVWYPIDAKGAVAYDKPMIAERSMLPVDPATTAPKGYTLAQQGQPGGYQPEHDVLDTWFTSSLTPQIATHWLDEPQRHANLFPGDVRPQSHEIIRTWAFYTIAKSLLHEGTVPWRNVLISGWVLASNKEKMSKSKGNVVVPTKLLDQYSSDACRYWSARARLGVDTAADNSVFEIGKRLSTKVFNAGKFVLQQSCDAGSITHDLDKAFIAKLRTLITEVDEAYAAFEFGKALALTEQFFWEKFVDTYLELVKIRARSETDARGRASAVLALRTGLSTLLRLLAPVLVYVTDEVWSWVFAGETGKKSIHTAHWPNLTELDEIGDPSDLAVFDAAVAAMRALHKKKSEAGVSIGRGVRSAKLAGNARSIALLEPVLADVALAVRAEAISLDASEADDLTFEVREIDILPAAPAEG